MHAFWWQFCAAIQLSPKDMGAYLDLLDAVVSKTAPYEVLRAALEELRSAEPALQVYAVPQLVRRLRSEHDRGLQDQLSSTILAATDSPLNPQQLARLSSTTPDNLATLIRDAAPTRTERATSAYLDVGTQGGPVLALSLLRELAHTECSESSSASDWATFSESILVGTSQLEFIEDARNGQLGRLPQLLCYEALALIDEDPAALSADLTAADCTWAGQPDLINLVLRLEARASGIANDKQLVGWAIEEAVNLQTFSRKLRGASVGDIQRGLAWLRPLPGQEYVLAYILWQATAWGLAATIDPGTLSVALAHCWGPPSPMKRVTIRVTDSAHRPEVTRAIKYLVDCRNTARGKESTSVSWSDQAPSAMPSSHASFLLSPWIDRLDATYSPTTLIDQSRPIFPRLDDNAATLRLLANLPTVRHLISNTEGSAYLNDLILHALDVFWDPRWRTEFKRLARSRDQPPALMGLSPVLVGIAAVEQNATERLAKGLEQTSIPRQLVDHTRGQVYASQRTADRSQPFVAIQLRLLHRQAAAMHLSHVAFEALSGEAWDGVGAAASPWFRGGTASPAADITRFVLLEIWNRVAEDAADPSDIIQEPALLAIDKYPEILQASERTWDWLADYRRPRAQAITGRKVLLSKPLPIGVWRTFGKLKKDRFANYGVLAAYTERLAAYLAAGQVASDDTVFTTWRDRVDRIDSEMSFDRALRRRLVSFLREAPGDSTALDVQRLALAAVMEFSKGTIRYQSQSGQALLTEPETLPRLELQLDWVHALLQRPRLTRGGLQSPWALSQRQVEVIHRERLLEQFLAHRPASSAVRLLAVLDQADGLVGAGVPAVDSHPIGLILSRRRENGIEVLGELLDIRVAGLSDPFVSAVDDARRLGIVVGEINPEMLLINVGEAEARALAGTERKVGSFVAVDDDSSVGDLRQAPPKDGTTRHATLTLDDGTLQLEVERETWGLCREMGNDSARLWLLDPSMIVGRSASTRCRVAYHQASSSWVPAIGTFARMILEQFPGAAGFPVTFAVIADPVVSTPSRLLAAVELGRLYSLESDVWTIDSWKTICSELDGLSDGEESFGLLITAHLVMMDGKPLLALSDSPGREGVEAPFDHRNVRWRSQFRQHQTLIARRKRGSWVTDSAVSEIQPTVTVKLELGTDRWPGDESTEIRVRVSPAAWNLWDQARGQLGCAFIPEVRLPIPPGAANLRSLRTYLALKPGAELRLSELSGSSVQGFWEAYTVEGLPVWVEKASLFFGGTDPSEGFVVNRRVVVRRHWGGSTSGSRKAIPLALPELSEAGTALEGIVTQFGQDDRECEVWLDAGAVDVRLRIPIEAFESPVTAVGEQVEARLSDGGWLFAASTWRPVVSALWKTMLVADAPRDALLLDDVELPGIGKRRILQSPTEGILYYAQRGGESAAPSCGTRGAERALARALGGGHRDEGGRAMDVVSVRTPGREWVGEAVKGQFSDRGEPWSTAVLRIEPGPVGEPDWVFAHREFTRGTRSIPGEGIRRTDSRPRPQEARHHAATPHPTTNEPAWLTAFRNWEESGDGHAIGRLDDSDRLLLHLSMPVEGSSGEPITELRLRPTDLTPWVRGRSAYYLIGARVAMRRRNGRWYASVRRAAAISLADFERLFGQQKPRLYYAGKTPQGHSRFEWGFGWTLELEASEISRTRRGALWFGDCIQRYEIRWSTAADGTKRPVLHLIWVEWEVEHRIRDDAKAGILHHARVQVSRRGARHVVEVREVETRTRRVASDSRSRRTTRERVRNVVLDTVSQERLLAELRNQGADLDAVPSFTILVRLDQGNISERTGHEVFRLITPQDRSDGVPGVQPGESLILTAGSIRPKPPHPITGISNDVEIIFHSQSGSELLGNQPLEVSVLRRDFSVRESTLRLAYEKAPHEFAGQLMLVELRHQRDDGVWVGSVVDAPGRSSRSFGDWIRGTDEPTLVAVGKYNRETKLTTVEVAPGVLGHLPLTNQSVSGSICVLSQGDNGFYVTPVVKGEASFVPANGRPAQLLLTDQALRNRGRTFGGPQFTVAGLPSLFVAAPSLATTSAHQYPPRVALVTQDGGRFTVDPAADLHVGRLMDDGTIIAIPKSQQDHIICEDGWPSLSFLDDSPSALAAHTRRGRWYYHDETTGIWGKGRNGVFKAIALPHPARSKDGPLFFDEEWRLRYRSEALMQYAYPAHELLEHGLPQRRAWYPVAGSRKDGLYLELSPGRIVDLPAALVRAAGASTRILTDMRWGDFAPGDLVRLSPMSEDVGTLATFRLAGWRYGPRGYFGSRRTLLPAQPMAGGGWLLGLGDFTLKYPIKGEQPPAVGWLGGDNTFEPFSMDPEPGDVVLLGVDMAGAWLAHGLSVATVELAQDWGGYHWLRELLADSPEETMGLLGGALPVLVEGFENSRLLLGPPVAREAPGVRMLATVLGPVGKNAVLLRSGASLHLIPLGSVLPGCPDGEIRVLLDGLTKKQIWLRCGDDGWTTASPAPSDEHEIRPLAASAAGIVCENVADLSLEWLPREEIGWIASASAPTLVTALRQLQNMSGGVMARTIARNTVSIVQSVEGRRLVGQLGDSNPQRVLVLTSADDQKGPIYHYVGAVFPSSLLITLTAEQLLQPDGVPIGVDMHRLPGGEYAAVAEGHRRTHLNVSPWLAGLFRECRVHGVLDGHRVDACIRARFSPYQRIMQGEELPNTPIGFEMITEWIASCEGSVPTFHPLIEWLRGDGRALLMGAAMVRGPADSCSWDVAQYLAGVLLLDRVGRSGLTDAAELAVHACSRLAALAATSIHEEVLIEQWLLSSGALRRSGRWARLARLQLGGVNRSGHDDPAFDGELTDSQLMLALAACDGILNMRIVADRSLRSIAYSLAYALGRSPREGLTSALEETRLHRLLVLGRTLTPGQGISVAQSHLYDGQLTLIQATLRSILGNGIPLAFMPENDLGLELPRQEWVRERIHRVISQLTSQVG